MKIFNLRNIFSLVLIFAFNFEVNAQNSTIEEVIVSAEKRDESLQDISQAVSALTDSDLENKNIESFVDLSAIVPGVTVSKNEGYKTVISIRGVGNETNQNAIAAPSVAFHIDGVFIASPFSLLTDFIDIERIEVLRGPQGTLFGQNSTGGAINVISKKPTTDDYYGKADLTIGNYDLLKYRTSVNIPVSEKVATRFSFSSTKRDGFSENIVTGQDLDDANNISLRSDWAIEISDSSSLRIFAQYFDIDRNGAAMRGIDDQTSGIRNLAQNTVSEQELTSQVLAAIYEQDLGYANLKIVASSQDDDISVTRDNDRHNIGDSVISIPGLGAEAVYQQAEFRPETSTVDTTTFEVNLVSNDPILDGKLDWTVGAFYMNHEIENHIRGYRDNDNNPAFKYVCSEPFADPGYCYTHDFDDPFAVFGADFDFVTDAYPSRKSYSIYAQTTYSLSETSRLVSGLRYSKDKFATDVTNFFSTETFQQEGDTDEITGKIVYEYDLSDSAMTYISYSEGFKPGGSNLTFGFEDDNAPAMVFPTFESETVSSLEAGLKTDLMDGRARANIAVFSYDYENLQFQATDPDPYRGGVANIPESEMSGVEIEIDALINDNLTLDLNLSKLDTEVTSDYEVLDNVDAYAYFFGEEDIRYGLRENVRGNMLAKSPESSADLNLIYETGLASGNDLKAVLQIIKRGDFMQRVSNNPVVDAIDSYTVINLSVGIEYPETYPVSKVDLILLNASDKDGVNSSMTDVFGVAATGIELIAPRQFMVRLSKNF